MEEEGSSFSNNNQIIEEKYDVFLNFRGEDTRNIFVGHLYTTLRRNGIKTFLDDDKLERGRAISPELDSAIENSRCSVVILSRNYAYSTWCLDELAKIIECMNINNQMVYPIFYHVQPTDVRKQTRTFAKAFAKHEQVYVDNMAKIQRWRAALTQVANLSGQCLENGCEAKFIEKFVADLSSKVASMNITKGLFGMEQHMEKLNSFASIGSEGVRTIGICGMCGIGKTTIAREYHNWMSTRFEGSSFLQSVENVREGYYITPSQNQLLLDILKEDRLKVTTADEGITMIRKRLRNKKVLVIIDNVDDSCQLKYLVGSLDWFGSGSRIIITTRDENLLTKHGVSVIYKVEPLKHDQAFQLFCWHAFNNTQPLENYKDMCKQLVEFSSGVPLAIELLGCFLFDKGIEKWEMALNVLKVDNITRKDIISSAFKLSFDGLNETGKKAFLDIACFLKGKDREWGMKILGYCGLLNQNKEIKHLVDKFLLRFKSGQFWMRDVIQKMGQDIVRAESYKEPGRRSRLWFEEDFRHALRNKTASEEVEAICLTSTTWMEKTELSCEGFSKMKKLRLLILSGFNLKLLPDVEYLSNELRFMEWNQYPCTYLPSSFQPNCLVELILHDSQIEQLWDNCDKILPNLKIMDLRYSKKLTKINFSVVPNLEELILRACGMINEIEPSITVLEKLTLLDVGISSKIEQIPTRMAGLKSLKVLDLYGCPKLCQLPEDLGLIKSLEKLVLGATGVKTLPSSVTLLENLEIEGFMH